MKIEKAVIVAAFVTLNVYRSDEAKGTIVVVPEDCRVEFSLNRQSVFIVDAGKAIFFKEHAIRVRRGSRWLMLHHDADGARSRVFSDHRAEGHFSEHLFDSVVDSTEESLYSHISVREETEYEKVLRAFRRSQGCDIQYL